MIVQTNMPTGEHLVTVPHSGNDGLRYPLLGRSSNRGILDSLRCIDIVVVVSMMHKLGEIMKDIATFRGSP